jgi:hypothetical protein
MYCGFQTFIENIIHVDIEFRLMYEVWMFIEPVAQLQHEALLLLGRELLSLSDVLNGCISIIVHSEDRDK